MTAHIEMAKHRVEAHCPSCAGGAPRPAKIAIIGGGFSGTLVLANLVADARTTEIDLFEARDDCGPGTAYRTRDRVHLLNVRADRMGAMEPEDFCRWLKTERGRQACAEFSPGRVVEATDYAPRALYGCYLKDLLARTLDIAKRRGVRVRIVRAAVTDMVLHKDGLEIVADGTRSKASLAILATGNFPPRPLAALSRAAQRSPRYVADPWRAGTALADRVGRLPRKSTILIFGTGLTAVDCVLSLCARGFDGKIIAVSRHGRLPLAQREGARIPWTLTIPPGDVAPSARALFAWLKREARLAEAEGAGWRSVFDAVRPFAQRLWCTLNTAERLKALRLLPLWNIHRHRMAPLAHARIEELRATGRLEIRAAHCSSVERRLGGFAVRLRCKGAQGDETIRSALVLNCTGPEHDLAQLDDPLLKNLLRRGLIMRSRVGGIVARDSAVAEGRNAGRIFAVGPLLVGELLETTAAPELRELARHAAKLVPAQLAWHSAVLG